MRINTIVLLAATILISCTTTRYIQKSTTISFVDFRPYTQKGFLFTPYDYKGDYESIGMIHVTLMPEAKLVGVSTGKKDTSGNIIYKDEWDVSEVMAHEALDTLRDNAIKMGADAIIHLESRRNHESYNIGKKYPITISGIEVEGFAIKRKGAFFPPASAIPGSVLPGHVPPDSASRN